MSRRLPLVRAALATGALALVATVPAAAGRIPTRVEGEAMVVTDGHGRVVADRGAAGRRALLLPAGAKARAELALGARATLRVAVRPPRCGARVEVASDGATVASRRLHGASWRILSGGPLPAGAHRVVVRATSACGDALRIDRAWLTPSPARAERVPAPCGAGSGRPVGPGPPRRPPPGPPGGPGPAPPGSGS